MGLLERIRQIQTENLRKIAETEAGRVAEQKKSQSGVDQEWKLAKAIFEESSAEKLLQELAIHKPGGEIKVQAEDKLISLTWGNVWRGSFVFIQADVANGSLTISGRESFSFNKNQLKNLEALEEAFAKVFVNPCTYDNTYSIN